MSSYRAIMDYFLEQAKWRDELATTYPDAKAGSLATNWAKAGSGKSGWPATRPVSGVSSSSASMPRACEA